MTVKCKMIMQAAQLEALLRHEEKPIYHREDYMSDEWQDMLLKRQKKANDSSSVAVSCPSSRLMKLPLSPRSVSKISVSFTSSPDSCSRTTSCPSHALHISNSSTSENTSKSSSPPPTNSIAQERITPQWREKICTWNFHVVDYYQIDREVAAISIHYLDRYLSRTLVDTDSFLLAAMTCLRLAMKTHHGKDRLSTGTVTTMSRGMVGERDMEEMELTLLFCLEWCLNPPTPNQFLGYLRPYIALCLGEEDQDQDYHEHNDNNSVMEDIMEIATFLTEISVCKYEFLVYKPSIVAFASILCALKHLKYPRQTVKRTREHVSKTVLGYDNQGDADEDLTQCSASLWGYCMENASLMAFSSSSRAVIS
mmetsp:Transcript_24112/g.50248  ORF Transcript_24112/g.50248 Transcript_24112/m.50248 type:complete len:366 (+) Transcript_24112:195-1292(+)